MPPSERDIRRWLAQANTAKSSPEGDDPLLRTAAIRAEQLTGDAAWDKFLTQIQARIDEAEKSAQYWLDLYVNSFDELNRGMRQAHYIEQKAIVTTLRDVMQLPKTILEEYRATARS